jgi:hypothetical protein
VQAHLVAEIDHPAHQEMRPAHTIVRINERLTYRDSTSPRVLTSAGFVYLSNVIRHLWPMEPIDACSLRVRRCQFFAHTDVVN